MKHSNLDTRVRVFCFRLNSSGCQGFFKKGVRKWLKICSWSKMPKILPKIKFVVKNALIFVSRVL